MFNVTGGELVIIFLVALVILGPDRLPKAAREIGKVLGQIRDVSSGFQKELKEAFHEPDEPVTRPSRPRLTSLEGGAESVLDAGWASPTRAHPDTVANDVTPQITPVATADATPAAAAAPPSPLSAAGVTNGVTAPDGSRSPDADALGGDERQEDGADVGSSPRS